METTTAKTSVRCDFCSSNMHPSLDVDGEFIKATLTDSMGERKDYDLCSEKCLENFLAKRNAPKKKKKAKAATMQFKNRTWEVDLVPE